MGTVILKPNLLIRRKFYINGIKSMHNTACTKDGPVLMYKRDAITLISINRPAQKNTLTYDVVARLCEAINLIEEDDTCKVAVLYGERGNFCAGYDLEEIKRDPYQVHKIRKLGLTERFSKKPIVAAVSGNAQGPGFELALWCDFRVVEENAIMGGFAKQLGLPMSDKTANKLTSMLGLNKSLDWILTGRVVKGKEAYEAGVATRLVSTGAALGQAFNLASGLAIKPESCLKADRAAIYLAVDKSDFRTKSIIEYEKNSQRSSALEEFRSGKFAREPEEAEGNECRGN